MRPIVFVVPGRIDTHTGGSIYDRRMLEALRQEGRLVDLRELDEGFPFPAQATLDRAADVWASIPSGTTVVVDGLALGAMPDLAEREAPRLRIVALVHLPLAADITLNHDSSSRLACGERRALASAALVVVTGRAALPMLATYDLPENRIVVVEPGTDPVPVARGSGGPIVHLLCVATLGPGKGHDILLRALADQPHRDWRLTCAGSPTRHPAVVARLRVLARDRGLQDRVEMAGDLDEQALGECYDRADLFVLATRQETYGMAVAEAIARGLPVVSTRTGAIPDLVGEHAGIVVEPGDSSALTAALTSVLGDAQLRGRLAEGARRMRERLPTWEDAARVMNARLARLDSRG